MEVIENAILSDHTWYKIGGKTRYLIICGNKKDIVEAIGFVKKENIKKLFVFGLGSNLIFPDEFFDGVVIQISTDQNSFSIGENGVIEVFAGVEFDDLIRTSFENNLTGLEWAGGLPGTVGGAVRGNAGAYGGEVRDNLVKAEVLDYSGEKPIIKILTNEELQFSYRNSFIKENRKMIVLSAQFQLQKAEGEQLENARMVYSRNIQNRKDKHPLEYPNTGSVFINPRKKEDVEKILSIYPDIKENVEKKWYGKVAVASLIDRWGLKGYRVGNAQISEKHALFIVNLGGAKAADVLQIIDTVKQKFFNTLGFPLEVEVEIVNSPK